MCDEPSPPLPILGSVTFLYTRDLPGTARFYAETLGLPLALDQGPCRIFRTGPSSFVGVCDKADRAVQPAGVVFTMITPDVDGWWERLRQAGVPLDGPPRYSPTFRVYAFFAFDPNGYRIEFQQFRDSAWPGPG